MEAWRHLSGANVIAIFHPITPTCQKQFVRKGCGEIMLLSRA